MSTDRKTFLKQVGSAGALAAIPGGLSLGSDKKENDGKSLHKNPVGTSTYSFTHYWKGKDRKKMRIENCIEYASRMGFDGVEIYLAQMKRTASTATDYLNRLKKQAFHSGLDLYAMSTHQNFIDVTQKGRDKAVDTVRREIEIAYELGIPTIRIETGTWEHQGSFGNILKPTPKKDLYGGYTMVKPAKGYTNEDAFKWVIDGIRKCVLIGENFGVTLSLENHWGLGRTADGLLRVHKAVDSPWLGILGDTGNFIDPKFESPHRYEELKAIAPYLVYSQIKTYFDHGVWYNNPVNLDQLAKIYKNAGFKGWLSLEYEGTQDPMVYVPKSLAKIRAAFDS